MRAESDNELQLVINDQQNLTSLKAKCQGFKMPWAAVEFHYLCTINNCVACFVFLESRHFLGSIFPADTFNGTDIYKYLEL